jgi:hypothetical protein
MILLCLIMSTNTLYAQEQEKKNNQELFDRIETLEKQLKKLEDESKARKSLEVTEEEKTDKEKDVLEAVGREYTLSQKGTFSLDYSLNYAYSAAESYTIQEQATQATLELRANRQAAHTLTHSISTSYSFFDNLSTSMNLPIVYRYNKMGTDEQLDQTDIGDISLGVGFQAPSTWSWLKMPGDIRNSYSLGISFPTGRSPYKINPKTELSTGSGNYSLSLGSSFSKQIDPVVLFWSIGYSYPLPMRNMNYRVQDQVTLEELVPGSSYSFSMGWGYAMSYATSINMSFSYGYYQSSTYAYKELKSKTKSGDSASGSFGVGMGIMVTPKTTASISLSYSLLNAGFSLTTRVPFDFAM